MKLKNIAAMPFALLADVVSCGNIGGNRSFTQQVMDKDKYEQSEDKAIKILLAILEQRKTP